jgi:hypothetical protein
VQSENPLQNSTKFTVSTAVVIIPPAPDNTIVNLVTPLQGIDTELTVTIFSSLCKPE